MFMIIQNYDDLIKFIPRTIALLGIEDAVQEKLNAAKAHKNLLDADDILMSFSLRLTIFRT